MLLDEFIPFAFSTSAYPTNSYLSRMNKIFPMLMCLLLAACTSKARLTEKRETAEPTAAEKAETLAEIPQEPVDWKGTWSRNEWQHSATLEIKPMGPKSFHFSLVALNGANTGDLEGVATVDGNRAIYTDPHHKECILEFLYKNDHVLEVEQSADNCAAGHGVTYPGTYENTLFKSQEVKSPTLVELGILQTPAQEKIFRGLVGDYYETFLNSTQLVTEETDLDKLHAKVFASGIRGLFSFMENIIMYNKSNEFWAAVIVDEEVFYFTNSKKFEKELPQTIEKWRTAFADKKVVFIDLY
jgi:hypothetical protein